MIEIYDITWMMLASFDNGSSGMSNGIGMRGGIRYADYCNEKRR